MNRARRHQKTALWPTENGSRAPSAANRGRSRLTWAGRPAGASRGVAAPHLAALVRFDVLYTSKVTNVVARSRRAQGTFRFTETVCWKVGRFWNGAGGTDSAETITERFWS
jgi:hypothetical protein